MASLAALTRVAAEGTGSDCCVLTVEGVVTRALVGAAGVDMSAVERENGQVNFTHSKWR